MSLGASLTFLLLLPPIADAWFQGFFQSNWRPRFSLESLPQLHAEKPGQNEEAIHSLEKSFNRLGMFLYELAEVDVDNTIPLRLLDDRIRMSHIFGRLYYLAEVERSEWGKSNVKIVEGKSIIHPLDPSLPLLVYV